MRALAALVLVVALAGCAPDAGAGTQRVEVAGVVTELAASDGHGGWVLDVNPYGVLPLDLDDVTPVDGATGVVVEVPDSVRIPDDAEGRFTALSTYAEQSGTALPVIGFLGG